jgi:hypothetical protein
MLYKSDLLYYIKPLIDKKDHQELEFWAIYHQWGRFGLFENKFSVDDFGDRYYIYVWNKGLLKSILVRKEG